MVLVPESVVASSATCVPENAKNKNSVVPTYSALVATKWLRALSGSTLKNGIRFDRIEPVRPDSVLFIVTALGFIKGMAKKPPWVGVLIFMAKINI